MRGELFRIFDFSAPSYSVLLLTGFLFATAAGAAWARRIGQAGGMTCPRKPSTQAA